MTKAGCESSGRNSPTSTPYFLRANPPDQPQRNILLTRENMMTTIPGPTSSTNVNLHDGVVTPTGILKVARFLITRMVNWWFLRFKGRASAPV